MESLGACLKGSLEIEETQLRLRLGLPGTQDDGNRVACVSNKRSFPESELSDYCGSSKGSSSSLDHESPLVTAKAQIVGWPPIRSYRRNNLLQPKKADGDVALSGIYVKVSLDGAPYLRKVDLKLYNGYPDLLKSLEDMFELTIGQYSEREGYKGSEYSPTYEDKDGDWMLVGDVPWRMFVASCKRLRIMRGSKAQVLSRGL